MTGCHGTTRLLGAGAVLKKDGALFGPPDKSLLASSGASMKARALKQRATQGDFSYGDRRKDATPSVDDKPVLGVRANKNFIVANAVEAILQGEDAI
jgi:hypothetical protein